MARLPTGMRQGGGRVPSAYRQTGQDQNYVSVGFQEVNIVDRPITQHGVSGMKTGALGPTRKVYDKSYYLGQLRTKIREIQRELDKFSKEMEQISTDNQQFNQLERKYEFLIKEVRRLEGELADYNLALDKQRTETRPEDIYMMHEHVQMQNERQKSQLDDLFLERKQYEDQITEFEQQIQLINQQIEMKVNSLDPETRKEYEQLQEENIILQQDISNKRAMLEDVNERLMAADQRLKMDPLRERAHQLKETKIMLNKKKEELEMQTGDLNLTFPQMREKLLNKVKEDNNQIQMTERKINEMTAQISNYHQQIKQIDQELKGGPNGQNNEDEIKKMEQLNKRDQEMQEFIDQYQKTKEQEIQQMQKLQDNIVAILAIHTRDLERQHALPSQTEVQE